MKGMSANRVQESNKSGKHCYILYLQIINLEYDEGLVNIKLLLITASYFMNDTIISPTWQTTPTIRPGGQPR